MTTVAAPTVPLKGDARMPRALAIRAALLLLFGLIEGALILFAFRIPNLTIHELVVVLAVYLLADGGVAFVEAAGALTRRAAWLAPAGTALVSLAAGLAILVMGGPQGLRIFAVWAIVTGFLEVVQDSRTAKQRLAAFVAVVFGLLVLAGPIQDRAMLMLAGAVFAIIAGGLRLGGALHAR